MLKEMFPAHKGFTGCLLLLSAVISAVAFTACSEEAVEETPVIRYVRFTDPAGIAPLLGAPRGSTIAFVGEGLGKVCGVSFNGVEAPLNPVYVTPTTVITTIPTAIPEVISHTVRLRTSDGRLFAYSPFVVELPAPRIDSLSDTEAAEGAELILYGAHFYPDAGGGPPTVYFTAAPDDSETSETSTADIPPLEAEVRDAERTRLTVSVPQGAGAGPIRVVTEYGTATVYF
jgi:hypothetical protein